MEQSPDTAAPSFYLRGSYHIGTARISGIVFSVSRELTRVARVIHRELCCVSYGGTDRCFQKKSRARWTGRRDPERKEPRLPPQNRTVSDADDPIPAGPRMSTLKDEIREDTRPKREPSLSTTTMTLTVPPSTEPRETTHGKAIGKLAPLDIPGSANDTRTNGQHDPFGDDLASIGEGIAALLAEESCEPAAGQAAASASSSPSFSSFLTEALNGLPPETEKPAPQRPREKEAPSSGTYSELQKRLITQIAEIMWFPKGTSETVREDRLIEAFDALVGIDPQDEIEGMLACQLVITHRAMLDCMQLSMAPSTAANDRAGIINQIERLMAVHARNLAALDQHRARNRWKPAAFGKRKPAAVASGNQG